MVNSKIINIALSAWLLPHSLLPPNIAFSLAHQVYPHWLSSVPWKLNAFPYRTINIRITTTTNYHYSQHFIMFSLCDQLCTKCFKCIICVGSMLYCTFQEQFFSPLFHSQLIPFFMVTDHMAFPQNSPFIPRSKFGNCHSPLKFSSVGCITVMII